jgi:hypothetical protein
MKNNINEIQSNSKNIIIADLIYYAHIALIIYILFGFIFLPTNHLPFYIILIILVFIDWNDYDGMCILTKLEYYFRYGVWIKQIEEINKYEEPAEFFRPLIKRILNIDLTAQQASRLNNLLFSLCLLFGFIRYWSSTNGSRIKKRI